MLNEFSERFKNLREARNLTQDQVAEKLGISRSTVAGYESEEKSRVPRKETLNKIADLFGTSTDYLLGREGDVTQEETPIEKKQKYAASLFKKITDPDKQNAAIEVLKGLSGEK